MARILFPEDENLEIVPLKMPNPEKNEPPLYHAAVFGESSAETSSVGTLRKDRNLLILSRSMFDITDCRSWRDFCGALAKMLGDFACSQQMFKEFKIFGDKENPWKISQRNITANPPIKQQSQGAACAESMSSSASLRGVGKHETNPSNSRA